MTIEQAKKGSDILEKINSNKEIIHNLTFSKTTDIRFGKANVGCDCTVFNQEFIEEIVKHSIFICKENILQLSKHLENL